MLVCVAAGTYSTVFIASSIAIILSQGKRRGAAVSATEPATAPTPGRSRQKKARAS